MHEELTAGLDTGAMKIAPGTRCGSLVFTTQVPLTEKGKLAEGGIEGQAHQLFRNFAALMAEAGGSLADVVQLTVFLVNPEDIDPMHAVYQQYFTKHPFPSRATVFVAGLSGGFLIEVTAHAVLSH